MTRMKKVLLLVILLWSLACFSQYTSRDIKKFRIERLTTTAVTSGSESAQKSDTWYDEYGNDTAQYNNGELYRRTRYVYDSKGQVVNRTRYDADGKEIETAAYSYKPDGSGTISTTDKSFGITDYTYCDKTGRITRTASPDGTERIHSYDAKGKLLSIKSM